MEGARYTQPLFFLLFREINTLLYEEVGHMTIGQYLNKNHSNFRMWGILANWYRLLYKVTKQAKWQDKSVEYLDKRWLAMTELMNHG